MIIYKLKEQKGFSSVEREIANYILSHSNQIINTSIRDIARETFYSPSTIIRLCKKIGMSGYLEFRISFNSEINSKTDTYKIYELFYIYSQS